MVSGQIAGFLPRFNKSSWLLTFSMHFSLEADGSLSSHFASYYAIYPDHPLDHYIAEHFMKPEKCFSHRLWLSFLTTVFSPIIFYRSKKQPNALAYARHLTASQRSLRESNSQLALRIAPTYCHSLSIWGKVNPYGTLYKTVSDSIQVILNIPSVKLCKALKVSWLFAPANNRGMPWYYHWHLLYDHHASYVRSW